MSTNRTEYCELLRGWAMEARQSLTRKYMHLHATDGTIALKVRVCQRACGPRS